MSTNHCRFSPSHLAHYEACPQFLPSPIESEQAAEGTLLHDAVARKVDGILQEREHRDLFASCMEFLAELEGQYPGPQLVEHRVTIRLPHQGDPDGAETRLWGTLDRAYFSLDGTKAALVDFKFGRVPVPEAQRNAQLQTYSLGLFQEFPGLVEVTPMIVQPRLRLIDQATIGVTECDTIALRINTIIARVHGGAPAAPSAFACMYCGRKATCEALCKTALAVSSGLNLPASFDPTRTMVPADYAKLQDLSKLLEDWCAQVRKENTRRVLEDGVEIPGYRLVERAGTPKVNDTAAAAAKLVSAGLLDSPEELLACSNVSVSTLTDYVNAAKKGDSDKKGVRALIEHVLEDVLTYGEPTRFLQASRKKE